MNPISRCVGFFRPVSPEECDALDLPRLPSVSWRGMPPLQVSIGEVGALVGTVGDIKSCTDPARLKRRLMKLHVNYGHASAFLREKLVSQIPGIRPETMRLRAEWNAPSP